MSCLGGIPHPLTVKFLWRAPYKPSFSTVCGPGIPPSHVTFFPVCFFFPVGLAVCPGIFWGMIDGVPIETSYQAWNELMRCKKSGKKYQAPLGFAKGNLLVRGRSQKLMQGSFGVWKLSKKAFPSQNTQNVTFIHIFRHCRHWYDLRRIFKPLGSIERFQLR